MKCFAKSHGKKYLLAAMTAGLTLSLCACSGGMLPGSADGDKGAENSGQVGEGGDNGAGAGTDGTEEGSSIHSGTGGTEEGSSTHSGSGSVAGGYSASNTAVTGISATGGLRLLTTDAIVSTCSTEDGFYYLTNEMTKLRDGSRGSHLMYMDYASTQEIFLCSTAGCGHDSADCPAVFPSDAFTIYTTKIFIQGDGLYILSRGRTNDETTIVNFGDSVQQVESEPSVLYRANLDGTERRQVYTFTPGLAVEEKIMGDGKNLYVITKEISADNAGGADYKMPSNRKLMRLNLEEGSIAEVCSLNFEDSVSRKILGCYGDYLLLNSIDFGREVSQEELWDDDIHKELFDNSFEVCELLDVKTGELKEVCRISNSKRHSMYVLGNKLYVSFKDSGELKSVDPLTGEEKKICTFPQNNIMGNLGNLLCCRDHELADNTWYFVDPDTGKVTHSTLTGLSTGWALEFQAVTEKDVLVIYDHDAIDNPLGGGSMEILQYKYALISIEDLLAGRPAWRSIKPAKER